MGFTLTLALPRDHYSVPVARRVLTSTMALLGVLPDDEVTFTSRPAVGTVVHLEKQLEW